MAKSIKTKYYTNATARCQNCNSTYDLGSTQESTLVEICGHCHPFYTGQEVVLDTAGRIEKFQQRLEKVQGGAKVRKTKTRKAKQSLADLSTDDSPLPKPRTKKAETKKPDDKVEPEKVEEKIVENPVDNNLQNSEANPVNQKTTTDQVSNVEVEDVTEKEESSDQEPAQS